MSSSNPFLAPNLSQLGQPDSTDESSSQPPTTKTAADSGPAVTRNEDERVATEIDKALRNFFPMEGPSGRVRLDLDGVEVDRSKDDLDENPGFINDARAKGQSYELPIKGNFEVKVDGETVDTHRTKLGPYFPTVENLGTRMIDGKHYQNKVQVRRKPGVYPFRKEGEPQVEFNSEQGGSYKMVVDAEGDDTPTLDLQVTGQNRKTIERGGYALMKMFGVSDEEIQEITGDLYKYNAENRSVGQSDEEAEDVDLQNTAQQIFSGIAPQHVQKEFDAGDASFEEIAEKTRSFLEEEPAFDEAVNAKTLDRGDTHYSPEVVKTATERLIQTMNGQYDPPHRFSESFRSVHGLPTQLRENIARDRKLKGKMTQKVQRSVEEAEAALEEGRRPATELSASDMLQGIKSKMRTKLRRTYTNSDLSTTTETNNILDIDNRGREITIKGPGGIQSEHAIQPENIELHPSRIGLIDFLNTPTGSPGRSMPVANGAEVAESGEIERRLYDRKTGETTVVTSSDATDEGIGFTDEFNVDRDEEGNIQGVEPKSDTVFAGKGDEVDQVPEDEVRYVLPDMSDAFADGTNIVPFLNHNSGPRAIMGSRQMGQGVSLKDGDAPLVQTVDATGDAFANKIGRRYNATAEAAGTVTEIADEHITVETEEGDEKTYSLFNDLPLNQGGFLDTNPIVEEGDSVEEGELLTTNNYTDEEGTLAIGKNLDVAYTPWRGYNFEDAMVMSETGAKKMTSEHLHEKVLEKKSNDILGLDAFDNYLADRGSKEIEEKSRRKIDDDGVIQEGETVEPGEPLIAGVSVADLRNDPEMNEQLESMFENLDLNNRDRSVYWEKPYEGEVTRVEKHPKETRVYVKSKQEFREGDKISGFDGGKGIVSKILPDDQMPQREDGSVPDMLIDPHGVPSRANPGQIFELAAGKLADKTGETYEIENFDSRSDWEDLKEKLDEHDISVREDLVDPNTGKTMPSVAVGKKHIAKLKHMLEKKFAARGMNGSYDMDEQPTGGASMDNLTVHAAIGHNARANLSEMTALKGTNNADYWSELANNSFPTRSAEVPFSMKKFAGMLKSVGINIEEDQNDALRMMPLTDEDVEEMSSGEIETGERFDTWSATGSGRGRGRLDPFEKGLFDPNLVGESGKNWNHVDLSEPVPNPMFKKGIQTALAHGLSPMYDDHTPKIEKASGDKKSIREMAQKDVKDVYLGDATIHLEGEELTGGDGLKEALSNIDPEKAEETVRQKAKNYMEGGGYKADRADMYKQAVNYFANLNDSDTAPEDAFMTSKIPVLPAEFRQPLVSMDGEIHQQPVNKLYASVIEGAKDLKVSKQNYLPEEHLKESREGLMQDLGALMGDGSRPRGDIKARSIMDQIAGGGALSGEENYEEGDDDAQGPKGGYAQRKVMKKKQDLSGRSTIVPSGLHKYEPTDGLGIDELGLPEEMAWKIYEPFVRQRLSQVKDSYTAMQEYDERTDRARRFLEKEMEERPVLVNRAPSWWPGNLMAHQPTLIEEDPETEETEKVIRIPNEVVAPFQGGDFDGDTVSIHLPAEDEAVAEAHSMKPSRNIRAPGSKKLLVQPDHSQLLGLNDLSKVSGNSPVAEGTDEAKTFDDVQAPEDLVQKYVKDDVPVHQKVDVPGEDETWTPGWAMIDKAVRAGSNDEVGIKDLMSKIEGDHPDVDASFEGLDLNDDTTGDVMLESLMRHYPEKYADVTHQLSMAGARRATEMGFSVGFEDIKPEDDMAERHYSRVESKIDDFAEQIAEGDEPTEEDRNKAKTQLLNVGTIGDQTVDGESVEGAMTGMESEIESRPGKNPLVRMMQVGSRSSPDQIRQLAGSFGLVEDVHKNQVPKPIKSSLNRGLKGGEYYLQQHGALKGLRDRAVETSKPGYLGKQIIAGSNELIVTEHDCGTTQGKEIPLHNDDGSLNTKDLQGRYLADTGEELDGAKLSALDRAGNETVEVRSPLTCEADRGVCQKCYGTVENGGLPEVGDNVGVREGQAIIEASTKLTLKSFHSCLDRRTTVPVRQDGEVRMPSLEELWSEQSTPVHTAEGGAKEWRELDEPTEVYDNGSWTQAKTLMRHPQERGTEMTLVRTADSHFLIGQDNHPSMLSESQSRCPECGKTLRVTHSGKTRYCRYCEEVNGIDAKETPPAEETQPRNIEDRSHKAHTAQPLRGSKAQPPVEDGWLAGMFVAEGSVRHVKETWKPTGTTNIHPRSVSWSQQEGPVRDRLEQAITAAHAEGHGDFHATSSNGESITVDSTPLARRYTVFGRGSENKGLPGDFIGYSDEWLADFLAGVIDGDGTIDPGKRGTSLLIDTTSPLLVQQIQVICERLDIWATFSLTTNRELTRNQGFQIRLENEPDLEPIIDRTERFQDFPIKDEEDSRPKEPGLVNYVRPVYYEDRPVVYDIETASGTLSGNGIWTHNTGAAEKNPASFERFEEITNLKPPKWKAHIAKGDPDETFEVDDVSDVFAQGGKVGTDVQYTSKDTGETKTTRIPEGRSVRDKVEPGQELQSGEMITESGNYDPFELKQTKGLDEARDYLTRELHSIFDQIGGIGRRSAETTLASMSDYARVKDPGDSEWAPGDMVRSGKISAFNKKVDDPDEPVENKIDADPKLTPIGDVPTLGKNWLAKTNFQYLKRELTDSAIEGHTAETHGTSPVSAYMYGKDMDKGIDDDRWEY